MTTTGELYAIIEELELVDIGDAASYLGEEAAEVVSEEATSRFACTIDPVLSSDHSACAVC